MTLVFWGLSGGNGTLRPISTKLLTILGIAGLSLAASPVFAQTPVPLPTVSLGVEDVTEPGKIALTLQILALMTVLSIAPAILILTTSFTRIAVVLSFLRTALGTQQLPPNQVLIGLALFLTFFVMAPTWSEMNATALQPYLAGELEPGAAFHRATGTMKDFMLRNTRTEDIGLFVELRNTEPPQTPEELGFEVIVPSFVVSELKTAFQMGFVLYIPFLVIDMVVASVLMSISRRPLARRQLPDLRTRP
jgi:flagellar biosynthetic protein FliP